MEASNLVGGPVVKEVLNGENYKAWCVFIKNYLLSQDLWDGVVENISEPSKPDDEYDDAERRVWRRKNAAALHVIQMSCGPEALSLVVDIPSAKLAWDALTDKYKHPLHSTNSEIPPAGGTSDHSVKEEYDQHYALLYKALRHGDWKAAKEILDANPEGVRAQISLSGQTALHTAVLFQHLHIVEELVKLMSEQDMELKDIDGYTALATAARVGVTKIAECMIKKNRNLLVIPTLFRSIPVTLAAGDGHLEMARYLYSVTPLEELVPEKGYHGATLLNQCFATNTFDLALDLLQRCPSLAITPDSQGCTFLFNLASKSSLFPSGCRIRFWQRWIYNWIQIEPPASKDIRINIQKSNAREKDDKMSKIPGLLQRMVAHLLLFLGIKRIYELKLAHTISPELLRITCNEITTLNNVEQMSKAGVYSAMLRAADRGIPEFIIEVTKANTDLAWSRDNLYRTIFFHAIEFRQPKVFSLIYGHSYRDSLVSAIDKSGNNLLHMAGMLAPSIQLNSISGAALQMQREIQWFKEVESIMKPAGMDYRNDDGMTARELFTKNHKDLVKEGEKWMKETASSCTVVGALIVTIMFAAAFTVPGGNDQNTGYPMFQNHKLFMLFIMSDAVSLFSSTTSVLMFLGILTSRYAEDDFLKSLPIKLIIGLSMLFISIAAMMMTFCAAISVMLPGRLWIVIPVILFASVPVSLFVWLQFPLLVEIYLSTYGRGVFDRNVKRWF